MLVKVKAGKGKRGGVVSAGAQAVLCRSSETEAQRRDWPKVAAQEIKWKR
jgi:hypothetical protein